MFTRLKICGITNSDDAQRAIDCGVEILGFNFYSQSLRYISPAAARKIIEQLPFTVASVGILVNPAIEEIKRTIAESKVNAVQIYRSDGFCDFAQIPVPVIQAIRVKEGEAQFNWSLMANMILLDRYSQKQKGGTGEIFDWTLIPDSIPRHKLILAGGINPDNIREALQQVRPAIVDVASGAEISPGKKDIRKIKEMVRAILEFNLQNGIDDDDKSTL